MEYAKTPTTIVGKMTESATEAIVYGIESAAQMSLGRAVLKLIDRFLWVIEKSAQWSLPIQEITAEENGKVFGRMELVRPLPWILFLPGLIILRLVRAGLNIGAFILRYPAIQPSGVVKFVQKNRRRLRTIKHSGMKNERQRRSSKGEELTATKRSLVRPILAILSTLSCLEGSPRSPSPPPTRIRVGNDYEATPSSEEKSTTESMTNIVQADSKRKHSEVDSEQGHSSEDIERESLRSKIERLVLEDSEDDPDYVPPDSISEGSSTSSDNREDEEISLEEYKSMTEEAKGILRQVNVAKEFTEEEYTDLKEPVKEQRTNALGKKPTQGIKYAGEQSDNPIKSDLLEVDLAFYSPINSIDASPERSVSPTESDQIRTSGSSKGSGNGELNSSAGSTGSTLSGPSADETAEVRVAEKRSANGGKAHQNSHHPKGRRVNRKRK